MLTIEQQKIVERSRHNTSFAVKAFAGTGKTTTAVQIARANPYRSFLYVAFNRKVAEEARARFPENTRVATAHSLAFRAVGRHFGDRLITSSYRLKCALADRITSAYARTGGSNESANIAGYAVLETLVTFWASADPTIDGKHVTRGPYDPQHIASVANSVWQAMSARSGDAPMTHDGYLKLWQLGAPRIGADTIIFDECQDASPAMLDIVLTSQIPTIFIGDPWQAIYGWRGATDAFEQLRSLESLPLSHSWRFGPAVAELANSILSRLGEATPLIGSGEAT
ncbi:MAG: UvrD-helicase domain-containing protein, partial [Bacillati bacterium]